MYNRNDPRFRRTINQITSNLESANESAQFGIVAVIENYVKPCFQSTSICVQDSCAGCFPTLFSPEPEVRRARRLRAGSTRTRAAPEHNFDFYDDWEEDENAALLNWGNEEYESHFGDDEAPSGSSARQPSRRRQIGMNYGATAADDLLDSRSRRRFDAGSDNKYGSFFNKLPQYIAGKGLGQKSLSYQPSAEGLHDRPGGKRRDLRASAAEDVIGSSLGRKRSNTASSSHTQASHSSRGDLFPSDEEDAVPLDDEFEITLERASSGSGRRRSSIKDHSQRPGYTRSSTRSHSSRESQKVAVQSRKNSKSSSERSVPDMGQLPTISDLRHEEQVVQEEEETMIEQKRAAAQKLATERGLISDDSHDEVHSNIEIDSSQPVSVNITSEEDATQAPSVEIKDAEASEVSTTTREDESRGS